MSTLRHIAISLTRLAGHTSIGPTMHRIRYDLDLLMAVLGLGKTP